MPLSKSIAEAMAEAKANQVMSSTPNQLLPKDNQPTLNQQYGGGHVGRWVDRLPDSWIPFVQLARLSPPVGLLMAYFPHLCGSLLGGIATHASFGTVCRTNVILLACSFFGSNTGHAWNDLVDESCDRGVSRTCKRPIPRGSISRHAALIFAATQLAGLMAVIVLFLPRGNVWYVLPNLVAVAYYPFAKRHTHFAQLVLGFSLGWSVFMGSVSVGHEPVAWTPFELKASFETHQHDALHTTLGDVHVDLGIVSFFLAIICWIAISDTVYAHQDLQDDLALGLKGMAVLLQNRTKPVLTIFLAGMVALLAYCGVYYSFDLLYYVLTPAASLAILGSMLMKVDLKDSSNCWWWFQNAFLRIELAMVGGLLVEYALSCSLVTAFRR
ncbi:4-hydroxybenzoate polyprenyltransferase, mitochondrial [Cytospora mali]|uniref:4-hydroxybenzoate polyprenyltransferase, mitochondrial n=1 Tax=Cytospora mali TaxID=578113 RepID=A0A194V336_CYTMA|nr:4-hydroxybenzoate polyprenyltransferase, mitochondrial [Valsa mali var. pyri (nom. inval.)]